MENRARNFTSPRYSVNHRQPFLYPRTVTHRFWLFLYCPTPCFFLGLLLLRFVSGIHVNATRGRELLSTRSTLGYTSYQWKMRGPSVPNDSLHNYHLQLIYLRWQRVYVVFEPFWSEVRSRYNHSLDTLFTAFQFFAQKNARETASKARASVS